MKIKPDCAVVVNFAVVVVTVAPETTPVAPYTYGVLVNATGNV
jgi:hypothetical protein